MKVLVDTSVWIDYFRGGKTSGKMDSLIDDNLIAINDIVRSELLPVLLHRKEHELVFHIEAIEKLRIEIDWDEIIDMQLRCLQQGMSGIGIPDLIIAQNCIQNSCVLYSPDKHLRHLSDLYGLNLFNT